MERTTPASPGPDFNEFPATDHCEGRPAIGRSPSANAGCNRSEEHTSELQSLMRISYAVFCLKKKKPPYTTKSKITQHKPMYNTDQSPPKIRNIAKYKPP